MRVLTAERQALGVMGTVEQQREDFEYWLAHMDDALGEFIASLPVDLQPSLDSTVKSLIPLEAWWLSEAPNVECALAPEKARLVDGVARYVGETFRLELALRNRVKIT